MNCPPFLRDPFRFFFPLGGLTGVLGVAVWLPLLWDDSGTYPLQAHRMTMTGGFLLAFVTGFLTTAIPQFTSTPHLQIGEFLGLSLTQIGAIVFAFSSIPFGHYFSVGLTLTLLIFFALRRFHKRNTNPPFTFVFVGAALVLWGIASFILALDQFGLSVPLVLASASSLYFHGSLLLLVIGVGGRLIPGILGWTRIVADQRSRYENSESYVIDVPASLWVLLLVLLASYFMEGHVSLQITWLLRALVFSYVAIQYWKLYELPRERTVLTWGIWGSCWSFTVGTAVPVLWPSSGTHGVHMTFIGGFSLLTILVATRVTLAHGTRGKELESSSNLLKLVLILVIVAMITRIMAFLWPEAYRSHLGYAALLWTIGITLWGSLLVPRMVRDFELPKTKNP